MRSTLRSPGTAVAVVNCGVGFSDPGPLDRIAAGGYVVSTGFAAGLRPGIGSGAILLPQAVIGTDGRIRHIDRECHRRLERALTDGRHVSTEPLAETTQILATPSAKASAERDSGACGADMESSRIADYCAQHNLAFVVLRTVLDPVDGSIPRSIVDATAHGRVPGPLALASRLARRPADWPGFAALLRYVWVARRSLIPALAASMPALLKSPGMCAVNSSDPA